MLGCANEDIIQIVSCIMHSIVIIVCTAPFKENQDAFTVLPQLTDTSEYAFFAVYDGHGKDGTECARFCRDNVIRSYRSVSHVLSQLPACIRTLLEQSNGTPEEIKALLTKAHLQTNTRVCVFYIR